jgi:secreted trypsin-like serine protease
MRSTALVLVLAVAGCAGGAFAPGVVEEDIIGGTADTGDSAVVLLYMTVPGQQGASLCTGEVISPHVVLTAAHCTGGEDPTVTNTVYHVYPGPDLTKATAADLLPVKEAHFNPQFSVNNLEGGNDIGVVILQNAMPTTITPLTMNRTSLDAPSMDGKQVRFVGYGLDNATAQTGAGVKRQTTTTMADHTASLLHFTDGLHETCNGDSGGPAFMTMGGKEVIVGLTSFGDVNCAQGGYDTRVDALADWVDGYVRQVDPTFASNGMPPSPSGGTQTPPTSSVTPMPPSSAGTGGVGASCVHDADCQSSLCGLDDHGGHVCAAANANDVKGGIGCSFSGASPRDDRGATAAWLVTLVLLFTLGRAQRRARR